MKPQNIKAPRNIYTITQAELLLKQLQAYQKAADTFFEGQDMAGSPWYVLDIDTGRKGPWINYISDMPHLKALSAELHEYLGMEEF